MPRLSADQWEAARAKREAGSTFNAVASEFGVNKAAVVRRAKAEGWGDGSDLAETIRRKVTEKITKTGAKVTNGDAKKRAQAIDNAADEAAGVMLRHRGETAQARERIVTGLTRHKAAETKEDKTLAFEDLKAGKIGAEALDIIQRMERRAWGLEDRADTEIVITNPRWADS